MKVFVLFLFIYGASTHKSDKNKTPNVGTVLFPSSDTQKKDWTQAELGMLAARMYIQNLIPQPSHLNMLNEDYINSLLEYFKSAYVYIKRVSQNHEENVILTTALSDAIGGYLKLWALPVAKFAFYGGTLSKDSTLKLYQLYDDIKEYLKTDGSGWRSPDYEALRSVAVNVAPPPRSSRTRSIENDCSNLVFYQNSQNRLEVPLPQVDWNSRTATMFIPLKNSSIVPIKSSSNALLKYYASAKNCIKARNVNDSVDFDNKFQFWLTNDVLPHLKDSDLYLAFYSVLSLVNKTKDLCDRVIDTYGNNLMVNSNQKSYFGGAESCFSFNKIVIVFFILFVEVAWCIAAVAYMMYCKYTNNKNTNASNLESGTSKENIVQHSIGLHGRGSKFFDSCCKSNKKDKYDSSGADSDSSLLNFQALSGNSLKNDPSNITYNRNQLYSFAAAPDDYPVKESKQHSSTMTAHLKKHIIPICENYAESVELFKKNECEVFKDGNKKQMHIKKDDIQRSSFGPPIVLSENRINERERERKVNKSTSERKVNISKSVNKESDQETAIFPISRVRLPQRLNIYIDEMAKRNVKNHKVEKQNEIKLIQPEVKKTETLIHDCKNCLCIGTETNENKTIQIITDSKNFTRKKVYRKHKHSKHYNNADVLGECSTTNKPTTVTEILPEINSKCSGKKTHTIKKTVDFICPLCLRQENECFHRRNEIHTRTPTDSQKIVLKTNPAFLESDDTKNIHDDTLKTCSNLVNVSDHKFRKQKGSTTKSEEYPINNNEIVVNRAMSEHQNLGSSIRMPNNNNKQTETHLDHATSSAEPKKNYSQIDRATFEDKKLNTVKGSRIPILIHGYRVEKPMRTSSPVPQHPRRSCIPQLVRFCKDDSTLNTAQTKKALNCKLNITF